MADFAHVGVGHTLVFHAVARQEFTEVSLVVPWGMFDFVGGSAQLSVALVQFQVFFVSSCIRCGAPHCAIPTCIIDGLGPHFFALGYPIAQVQDLLLRGHWVQQSVTFAVNNAQTDVLIGSVCVR